MILEKLCRRVWRFFGGGPNEIMECRGQFLDQTLEGYNSTDIPLVSIYDSSYVAAGFTDDLGIYYFIPWIAKTFGLSISTAISVFFTTLVFMGTLISIICFFFSFKGWIPRTFSTIILIFLSLKACQYRDVYMAGYFAVATTVPLIILLTRKGYSFNPTFISTIAFSGFVIGYSNFVRLHSGTGVLIFLLFWILLNPLSSLKEKVYSLLILASATSLPYMHMRILERNRDLFLVEKNPLYVPQKIVHPKWHIVYMGLSYLGDNPYGIKYKDAISFEKAKSIDPDVRYCSEKYDQILREQCFLMLKNDPIFVFRTWIEKAFALLLRFLTFANIGIFLAFFYIKPAFRTVFPFLVAAAFYAIPGILALPIETYVLGLTATATLFGLYMICLSIEKFRMSLLAFSNQRM